MAFDIVSALKTMALTSKGPEARGVLFRAADELLVLKRIRAAVQYCVVANYGEKAEAWLKVKALCQVSEKE